MKGRDMPSKPPSLHPVQTVLVTEALKDPYGWTKISGSCMADFAWDLCAGRGFGEFKDYIPEQSISFRLNEAGLAAFKGLAQTSQSSGSRTVRAAQ